MELEMVRLSTKFALTAAAVQMEQMDVPAVMEIMVVELLQDLEIVHLLIYSKLEKIIFSGRILTLCAVPDHFTWVYLL